MQNEFDGELRKFEVLQEDFVELLINFIKILFEIKLKGNIVSFMFCFTHVVNIFSKNNNIENYALT